MSDSQIITLVGIVVLVLIVARIIYLRLTRPRRATGIRIIID